MITFAKKSVKQTTMTEMNIPESSEKKSLNFIEQIVEKDLKEGKNEEEYKLASRLNRMDNCTSDMPRLFVWISE